MHKTKRNSSINHYEMNTHVIQVKKLNISRTLEVLLCTPDSSCDVPKKKKKDSVVKLAIFLLLELESLSFEFPETQTEVELFPFEG